MTQHQDFCFQRNPRSKKPDQRIAVQSAELDHQGDDSPDSPPPANRIRIPDRIAAERPRIVLPLLAPKIVNAHFVLSVSCLPLLLTDARLIWLITRPRMTCIKINFT